MLTVPVPELAYEALSPSVAAAELPVTVNVGHVDAEGVVLTPVELSTFSLVTYRQLGPGASSEIWDPGAKRWMPEGATVGPAPLAYLPDQSSPWQGTVVAGGGEDAFGQPQFARAVGGYPSYSFGALFATSDEVALSGPSATIVFASVADRNQVVLGPGDGEKPDDATEARLLLKDPGYQVIGGLVVRRDSLSAEVTLSNTAGASVVLRADGAVEVRPGPGRSVVVDGDLETERITYRPAGGGPKQALG